MSGAGSGASPLRLERRGGVAVVTFHHPVGKVNKIDVGVLEALDALVAGLEAQPPAGGVLFISGRDHFCVGADVALIASLRTQEQAQEGSRRGQQIFGRLQHLPCTKVVAVKGSCLGGGLEWALACDRIVAADSPSTRLGLPEVRLGILPAWGGTQRLPRRIGLGPAIQLMASGRSLSAAQAFKQGLVDHLVPEESLEAGALAYLDGLAGRRPGAPPPVRRRGLVGHLAAWLPPARRLIFAGVRREVVRRAGPHYPAPKAIVAAVEASFGQERRGLSRERELFAALVVGETARNLLGLFVLNQEARGWYAAEAEAAAGSEMQCVAVLGAGVMGAGIAHLAASRGLQVILRDIAPAALESGLEHVRRGAAREAERGRLTGSEAAALVSRVTGTVELAPLAMADVVIEAVVEVMSVKKKVLAEAAVAAPQATLATNTSALNVAEMATALPAPGRLAGLHFFNPVEKMPLVEVIAPPSAAAAATGVLLALARRLGKVPVRVADAPGFLVNRILSIYLGEATAMVAEGYSIAALDRLLRDFGMPMGPLELLDQVGLDVATKVVGTLRSAFPQRMPDVDLIDRLLADGRTGEKGGLGFYRHHGKQKDADEAGVRALLAAAAAPAATVPASARPAAESDLPRLILPMVAEAVRCLEEKVVERPEEIDLALVMGIGWPPFRGGLLRYADVLGAAAVLAGLEDLAGSVGPRLAPPARLAEMAARGERFHRG